MYKYINNSDSKKIVTKVEHIKNQLSYNFTIPLDDNSSKILYNIYKNINKDINYIVENYDEKIEQYTLDSIECLNKSYIVNNLSSRFVSDTIREFIFSNNGKEIHYILKGKKEYRIIFVVFEASIKNSFLQYLDMCAINIFSLIYFLENSRNLTCKTETLEIYIFLTHFKKYLPASKKDIIGPGNVNTGSTIPCREKSLIVIYRQEEFLKLVIHEVIHSMGIHLPDNMYNYYTKELDNIFGIESTYNFNETYTEVWAMLLNQIFFISISNGKDLDRMAFIKLLNSSLNIELCFSAMQVIKILNFMDISLYDLRDIERNKNFKENTHVFAYYIMKYLLSYDINRFLEICGINNDNYILFTQPNNTSNVNKNKIKKMIDSIVFLLDSQDFKDYFFNIEKIIKTYLERNKKHIIFNTLRMTCIELA